MKTSALAAKIAVSVPAETFASLETERKREGLSRSAVVTQAIEAWIKARRPGDADRRYVEGYLKHPEHLPEIGATASAVVANWEPWEDES